MTSERALLEAVCDIGRRLYARNLLAAGDGNISVRMADGRIAITPSGVSKAFLGPEDMAFLDLEGSILSGRPSTERLMHLGIYRSCPEAHCVVHAHPPTAVAWTVARPDLQELPSEGLPELILAAGRIPIAPYAQPGTPAMASVLEPFLPVHRLLLLARHGAVCWAEDPEGAYLGMERLEHVAQILKAAVDLGGITAMNPSELDALRAARRKMGSRIL